MAQILRTYLFPSTVKIKDVETKEFARKLIQFLDDSLRKISGIPFNQSEALSVADTGAANVEFSITHHLGRVPNGYILTKTNKAASLYDGSSAWTTSTIYLKCSAANAAIELYVF